VTDAGLWELRDVTVLTVLNSHWRNVTDMGLQHLTSLKAPSYLDLNQHIHDPGGAGRAQGCPPRPTHWVVIS
jgi:hypothetical protein